MKHDPEYMELVERRDAATAAYMAQIKAAPPVRERTPEQQWAIDKLLDIHQKLSYEVWHYGIL